MRIVQADNVVQHPLLEKTLGRQIAPSPLAHRTFLDSFEDAVLLERPEIVKATAMPCLGFGVERDEAASPGFAHRRQFGIAITVTAILVQFIVEHGGKRHRPRRRRRCPRAPRMPTSRRCY
jgi:hypothetical protein